MGRDEWACLRMPRPVYEQFSRIVKEKLAPILELDMSKPKAANIDAFEQVVMALEELPVEVLERILGGR